MSCRDQSDLQRMGSLAHCKAVGFELLICVGCLLRADLTTFGATLYCSIVQSLNRIISEVAACTLLVHGAKCDVW